MTRRTGGWAASLAVAASLALAPAAFGAEVSNNGGTLTVTAGPDVTNNFNVFPQGDDIVVDDQFDNDNFILAPNSGCTDATDGDENKIICDLTPDDPEGDSANGGYTATLFNLGDRGDSINNSVDLPTTLNGGDGDDGLFFYPGSDDGAPGTLNGDAGNDDIQSGEGAQTINGGSGNDAGFDCNWFFCGPRPLDAGDGDDTINGGDGNDAIADSRGDEFMGMFGSGDGDPNGNDKLNGDAGNDLVCDGQGDETITGGADGDQVGRAGGGGGGIGCSGSSSPGRGTNTIDGGTGDDLVYGGTDADLLRGGEGDDDLYGSPGNDRAEGGAGDDAFEEDFDSYLREGEEGSFDFIDNEGDLGADVYLGGEGRDFVEYDSRNLDDNDREDDINLTLDGIADDGTTGEGDNAGADIEDASTGDGDDSVVGNALSNDIDSNRGDDSVDGRGGDDLIEGGEDRDAVTGGDGNDEVFGDEEDDCCDGAADVVDGGAGNDNLFGQEGNDTLRGGDDNDALYGGVGSDDISGGGGSDFVDFTGSQARVNVSLDDVANDGFTGEGDNVRSDVEDVIGSEANDDITGSTLPNTLSGGEGNDTIRSRDLVSDIVICGPGVDTALVDDLDIVDTEGEDRCERIEVVATPKPTVQGPTQTQTQTTPGPAVPGPTVVKDPPRVAPRGLTALVTPARDRKFPYRFTTRGTLSLPAGMSPAQGCKGVITVQIKRGKKTISTRRVDVKPNCTYSVAASFAVKSRVPRRGTLRIRARFNGNNVLLPARAKEVRVRYGR